MADVSNGGWGGGGFAEKRQIDVSRGTNRYVRLPLPKLNVKLRCSLTVFNYCIAVLRSIFKLYRKKRFLLSLFLNMLVNFDS